MNNKKNGETFEDSEDEGDIASESGSDEEPESEDSPVKSNRNQR